jgi:MFS family permease
MNESLNQPQATDHPATAQSGSPPPAASTKPAGATPPAGDRAVTVKEQTAASQFLTVFPPIMLPMFLAVADQTIVATALPAIASNLGEIERASWVVVSYLIANTIAAPVYGRLGDTFGRRLMMFVALGIFMLGSILCALAPTIELLTAFRVVQGFGGGGLMTLSQALIGEAIPPRERGRYQGYLAGVAVSSNTFGPVAGGYLTQAFGWQSIFLINIPLGLLAVLFVFRIPPRQGDRRRTTFDSPGLVLFILFVGPVILALEQVQRMELSTIPMALGLLAFGLVSLGLLTWQERITTSPLIPPRLFKQASIWRADLMAACHGAALVSLITFLPIYLRAVRRHRNRLDVYRADGEPNRAHRDISDVRTDRGDHRTRGDRVLGAASNAIASRLGVLRHCIIHGHGDGRRSGDGSGGVGTAPPWDRRGDGAVFALSRRRVRDGVGCRHSVFDFDGHRPQHRDLIRQHHRTGP